MLILPRFYRGLATTSHAPGLGPPSACAATSAPRPDGRILAGRATRVPHQTGTHGTQRTTTVNLTRAGTGRLTLYQLERIPRTCLIRMRSQVQVLAGPPYGPRPAKTLVDSPLGRSRLESSRSGMRCSGSEAEMPSYHPDQHVRSSAARPHGGAHGCTAVGDHIPFRCCAAPRRVEDGWAAIDGGPLGEVVRPR